MARLGMMGRAETNLNGSITKPRRQHLRPALAFTLSVAALAGGSPARAAGLTSISPDEFRSDITRLQGLVAQCAADPAGCDATKVGDDAMVGDRSKGGFEEHWAWLRDTLDKAKNAKAEERVTLLRDAEGQLEELAHESSAATTPQDTQQFGRAKADATEILSRGEFQRGGGPTWWDRVKARALEWIGRFFAGIAQVGVAAPWLGTLLEWLCFVGAAVGVLFFLLRNVARQRLRVSLENSAVQKSAWDREADDWAQWAEQHAEAGEWRDAVHCLYWAAIVSLEARRAWRHNPTRTPREYVRLLKPGSAQEQGLRRLTQVFERVWYGLRDANAEEYTEARAQYERLAAGGADIKSLDPLSAGGAA